jgi:two-component system, OmpR family, phosphate regulon sensor histidine kinase PhoR
MTLSDERAEERANPWLRRLGRARLPLLSLAVVLIAFWGAGALALVPALICFGILSSVFVFAAGGPEEIPVAQARKDPGTPQRGDAVIDALLGGLPDPVIALDLRGAVVALNAQAVAITPALRRGEPLSLGLRNPEVLEAVRRASTSGGVQSVEFFVRVPMERWYDATVRPIQLAADATAIPRTILLMTFRDLTPLHRVEEMRADFVANASHELRTPLAALSGFIETLRGSARDDPAARDRFLAIMQAQATRMARLIDDLLSLSRIELSAHLRPDKEVDLVSIIRQVADGLQVLASDRDVEVRVMLPPDRVAVRGDRDEVLRVLENLVENALKYAASGKRVDITLSTTEGSGAPREALIAVRDYGPGIAPEHLPRLTERFYRVDVAESRAQGGTGLGLALVKHILNRHGGRLAIESVPGQGATFTVHLPLAAGTKRKS